jgi:hypothetical protein
VFAPISMVLPDTMSSDMSEMIQASAHFDRISGRGLVRRLLDHVRGRCAQLLSLSAATHRSHRRTYIGVHLIPIGEIRGTEGRERDFDANFRPLQQHDKQRWMGVLIAMRRGASLPPVELIQVDGAYYVRDGHHRISVARQLGLREIEAEVTVWE